MTHEFEEPTIPLALAVTRLAPHAIPSPMAGIRFAGDAERVLYHSDPLVVRAFLDRGEEPPAFQMGGPRPLLHFDPARTRIGMVTCGGLCPGLNDVIRAVVLSATFHYGVEHVYGFRFGYQGLNPAYGHEPLRLTPAGVDTIGELGGTILGSSRGPQPPEIMVDYLAELGINILFTIGGDGTLRGAHAIHAEAQRRGLDLAVVGIPKTIDNDISFIQQSFGFQTASEAAHGAVAAANTEATGAPNGIGLVKLMGRESGFIAAYTALVDSMVNFCLVPEAPFTLDGFLAALDARIHRRGHAVIAVAEGAGHSLLADSAERDRSGNVKFGDIGIFLRDSIKEHFAARTVPVNVKYIDPSYTIRSIPANAFDSAFCLQLGHNAVHAAMAGFTDVVVGNWRNEATLVPIHMAVSTRKRIDVNGWLWSSVLASTGQPDMLT